MADEKVFTIPLRKEWLKVSKYKRAKKALSATRAYIQRHMKTAEVRIGKELNHELWSSGAKNPPHHIKVKSILHEGRALVELVDVPFEVKKEEAKKSIKEKLLAKKDEKPSQKKAETQEVRKELEKEREVMEKKEHEGHTKIPGKPEKEATMHEKQKNMKTENVVHESGKRESHSPKP